MSKPRITERAIHKIQPKARVAFPTLLQKVEKERDKDQFSSTRIISHEARSESFC